MCRAFKASNLDPGGFAEYVRVPPANVRYATFRIPDHLTDEEASFVEPLACCVRAVDRARLEPGDTVVVVGLGSIGCLLVQLTRRAGAIPVVLLSQASGLVLLALLLPLLKPAVAGLVGRKALRQIRPGSTCAQDPQYPLHHLPLFPGGSAFAVGPLYLIRHKVFYPFPLLVCQLHEQLTHYLKSGFPFLR